VSRSTERIDALRSSKPTILEVMMFLQRLKGGFGAGRHSKARAQLITAFAFVFAGCNAESPLQAGSHLSHQNGLMLSSLSQASNAQTLNALTRLSAPFHDVDAAEAAGYGLFKAPPLTAEDGCVSSADEGGMGYHYHKALPTDNLGDDNVELLDPEFLVYAPTNAPRNDGEARRRLAAFDYFIPYSAKWPGPDDPTFTRAPTLHDFSTMSDLPDVAFAPSRFNGWMFHIWLWEHNPGGMFTNWNRSVPLCEGSAF
jgi:hypothetical protein